jgi:hypothetical protein
MNESVRRALVYQRNPLRPKLDLSIRENLFYVIYEPRLKKQ